MVVAESHLQCGKEVITTLDSLSSPDRRSLYLCSWNKNIGDALRLYGLLKHLHNCEIVPEESLYLINGSWKSCSSQDPFLAKLNVEIGQDPVFDNDKLYLKVTKIDCIHSTYTIYTPYTTPKIFPYFPQEKKRRREIPERAWTHVPLLLARGDFPRSARVFSCFPLGKWGTGSQGAPTVAHFSSQGRWT